MEKLDAEQLEKKKQMEVGCLGGLKELEATLLAKEIFHLLMDRTESVSVARRVPELLTIAMSIRTEYEIAADKAKAKAH